MPWIKKHQIRIWIGRHQKFGLVAIPEAEIEFMKMAGSKFLSAYLVDERRIASLNAEVVKRKLESVDIGDFDADAISEKLEKRFGAAFFDSDGDGGAISSAGREDRRRKVIEKGGRATHCWNCKENINTDGGLLCSQCKWIKCECGACGCGWEAL